MIAIRDYSFGVLSLPSSPMSAIAKHAPEAMSLTTSEPRKQWRLGLLKAESSDIKPNIKADAPTNRSRLVI